MNANEAVQMVKLFETGAISRQTFYEKLGIDGDLRQAFSNLLKERIIISRQTFYEKTGISGENYWKAEEEDELLQKEKLEVQKVSRFDLI